MFAFLEGTVDTIEQGSVVLNVHGVGYQVYTARTDACATGKSIRLYITEVIREDVFDLYGFASKDEQYLFLAFRNVQGVGPKMALKILSAAPADDLRRHILTENIAFFLGVSGVGKKTAQKILLELRGVLVSGSTPAALKDDALEALLGLGYTQEDVIETLKLVTATSVEGRIRESLRILGRK